MKISVIIPCHNAEAYLSQAIQSVLNQTKAPHEVIVVDDASSDRSLEVARSFEPEIKVVSIHGGSASRTRTHGYSLATGDALMFLDADDVLSPEVLAGLTKALVSGAGVACCPWYRLELVNGAWVRLPASCVGRRRGEDPLNAWLRGWYHPTSSVLWRREAFEATGGWDPAAGPNDDGHLMMRALVQGIPFQVTDEGAMFYRRLPDGEISFSGTRFTAGALSARIWVIEDLAGKLRQQGRLAPFRGAIGTALRSLAADCGQQHPDLQSRCAKVCQEFGDSEWQHSLRSVAAGLRRRLGKLRRALKSKPLEDSASEVTYGRDFSP